MVSRLKYIADEHKTDKIEIYIIQHGSRQRCSDKGVNGTSVNRTCISLIGASIRPTSPVQK